MVFNGVDNRHTEEFVGVIDEMSVRKAMDKDGNILHSQKGADRYVLDISFQDDKDKISMFFAWIEITVDGQTVNGSHDTYSDAGLMLASLSNQGFDYDIPIESIGDMSDMPMTCSLKGIADVPVIMRPFEKKVGDRTFTRWECVGVGQVGYTVKANTIGMPMTEVPAELLSMVINKVIPMVPDNFDESLFVKTVNTINVTLLEGKGSVVNERRSDILRSLVDGKRLVLNVDGTYKKVGSSA